MATATKKKKGNQISKMIKAAKTKYVSIPEYLVKGAIKEAHLRDDSSESDTPEKVHSKIDSLINTIALISPKDKGRVSCIMYQYIVENNVEIADEHRVKLVEGIASNLFYLKKMLANIESDSGSQAYHDFMDYVSDDDAFAVLAKVISKKSSIYNWRTRTYAQRLVDGDVSRISVFLTAFMKCMLVNPEKTVDTILTAHKVNAQSALCYRRATSLVFLLIYMLNGFDKQLVNPVRSYASKTILYPEHHTIYKVMKDDISINQILAEGMATYSKRMDAILKVLDPKHEARIQSASSHFEHKKRPLPLKYHKKLMKMLQYIGDEYIIKTDAKGETRVHPEIVFYMLDDNLSLPTNRRNKSGKFKVQTEKMTGFLSAFGYTYEINVSVDIEKKS